MSGDGADPFEGRASAVAAFAIVTVFAWLSFIFLPVLIDLYIHGYMLGSGMAGALTASEVGSLTLTTLLISRLVPRCDKRWLCACGATLAGLGNLLSIWVIDTHLLLISRLVVGCGLGFVVAASNALPALSRRSEFLYALGQFALCVFGSALIFVLPAVVARSGPGGVFQLEIALAGLTLVCAPALPSGLGANSLPHRSDDALRINVAVVRTLTGAAVFYVAQTALWAFAGQAGQSVGFGARSVEHYLAASALCGVLGAGLAMILAGRAGVLLPITLGFGAQACFGLMLYLCQSKALFVPAVLMITFSSVFVTPYLLTIAARLDRQGRVASIMGGCMNLGASAGPLAAGMAAARFGDAWIGYGSAALLVIGLAVIHGPANARRLRLRVID